MYLFHFRDEKEKEREGNGHETDALSKYNGWTKATYTYYLAKSVSLLHSNCFHNF